MSTERAPRVALVTGASRGVGRGIALALGDTGATVYVTGRTRTGDAITLPGTIDGTAADVTACGGRGVPLACDHADDASVADAVDQIRQEHEGLDLLVNNVFAILDEASFIGVPFWEQSLDNRDRMRHVGLRSHYVASAACALLPIERRGLIVTISRFGARSFQLSTAYGVGKGGCDKLARDMAAELEPRGVCSLALYPGIVRTERIVAKQDELPFDLSKSESAEFTGRVVAALLGGHERLGSRGSRARRRPRVDSAHHGLDPSQQARCPSADGYGH